MIRLEETRIKHLQISLCVPPEKVIFTDGTNHYNTKTNHNVESLFSSYDTNKYLNDSNYDEYKNAISREFLSKIEKDEIKMSDETIGNFNNVFKKILNT